MALLVTVKRFKTNEEFHNLAQKEDTPDEKP